MEDRDELLVRAQTIIKELRGRLQAADQVRPEPIAIVGMAGRFPSTSAGESQDLNAFWHMTLEGRRAKQSSFQDRWPKDLLPEAGRPRPPVASFLREVDWFDAEFFDIEAAEAMEMDPAQRLFLEVAWHALEDAGQTKEGLEGSDTGVFVGHTGFHEYLRQHLAARREVGIYTGTGSGEDVIAGRLAYFLNLHGPAMTVNTACSSSLVAVHLARRSLLARECRMAVAGGVNILGPVSAALAMQMGFMAADGCCKVFDERADGFGRGEGCGALVLKRHADAVADGDIVHALIHGSAMNQDGRTNGLSAPNGRSQVALMRLALRDAGLTASQVGYVEAHGTGTSLGDLIEFGALNEVYGSTEQGSVPCALGSVKANVGHQEGAAGVAGLMRAALAIEHGVVPPLSGFRTLNPGISLENTRLSIPVKDAAWRSEYPVRLAGVSSFGWSGTNAHLVLGEAKVAHMQRDEARTGNAVIVTVSAKDPEALKSLAQSMAKEIERSPEKSLQDLAWSTCARRSHFEWRIAAVGSSSTELANELRARIAAVVAIMATPLPVNFLFGTEQPGCNETLEQLSREEPVFRHVVERCTAEWLREQGTSYGISSEVQARQKLFALQYGCVGLLESWGVRTKSASGAGVGRITAALVTGELEFASAIGAVTQADDRLEAAMPILHEGTAVVQIGVATGFSAGTSAVTAMPALRSGLPARVSLLQVAARLYEVGAELRWSAIFEPGRRMMRLPAYPFQRSRYWIPDEETSEVARRAPDEWFYETVWKEVALPAPIEKQAAGKWLILGDESGVAQALLRALKQRGIPFVLVRAAEDFQQVSQNEFRADTSDPGQINRLLGCKEIAVENRVTVMDLRALDLKSLSLDRKDTLSYDVGGLVSAMEHCVAALMQLCQCLVAAQDPGRTVKLYVATRTAQTVQDGDESIRLEQAPLHGFASAAALEHPELWGAIIDLPEGDTANGDAGDVLVRECADATKENRVAHRDGRRFVPRLRRVAPFSSSELRLRADATYLVTGAFGGIGLDLAEWLAASGARHLVLLGRSLPADDNVQVQSALDRMKQADVRVSLRSCDVGNFEQMSELFAEVLVEGPPIRGLLHAAADVIWKPIADLSAKDVEASFVAKVRGGLVLHELTSQVPLDFLVFFSSAAVSIGARNGAAYASANALMDALACVRRSVGLPGLSIQWGHWARRTKHGTVREQQFTASGMAPMDAAKATNALARMISGGSHVSGSRQQLIAEIDVRRLKGAVEMRGSAPFLSELSDQSHLADDVRRPAAIAALENMAEADRVGGLVTLVTEQLRRTMSWNAEREVDATRGFFDMGLDSLKSIQFKNYIEAATGTIQSSTLVFLHPNVDAVAKYLNASLFVSRVAGRAEEPAVRHLAPAEITRRAPLNEVQTRAALLAELEMFKGGQRG